MEFVERVEVNRDKVVVKAKPVTEFRARSMKWQPSEDCGEKNAFMVPLAAFSGALGPWQPNPILVARRLRTELTSGNCHTISQLARRESMSRARIYQYLKLLDLPMQEPLSRLKNLTEGDLRPLTRLDTRGQIAAVENLLSRRVVPSQEM
jgi:hypothetical protein